MQRLVGQLPLDTLVEGAEVLCRSSSGERGGNSKRAGTVKGWKQQKGGNVMGGNIQGDNKKGGNNKERAGTTNGRGGAILSHEDGVGACVRGGGVGPGPTAAGACCQ